MFESVKETTQRIDLVQKGFSLRCPKWFQYKACRQIDTHSRAGAATSSFPSRSLSSFSFQVQCGKLVRQFASEDSVL